MNREPMTVKGAKLLRSELEKLKNEDRPRVVQAIAEARAHGDLRENAEYHAAREQQSFMEGRILDIESKLARAEVIDVTKLRVEDRVVFGSTVTMLEETSGEETTYRIVGEDESDIDVGLLSYASPIARAIMGKSAGENIEVRTPGGKHSYKIVSIEYL